MDTLLTAEEVAERLRRPVATLRYWRSKKIGPPSANVNGRILYKASQVEAWVEEKFNTPQGAA